MTEATSSTPDAPPAGGTPAETGSKGKAPAKEPKAASKTKAAAKESSGGSTLYAPKGSSLGAMTVGGHSYKVKDGKVTGIKKDHVEIFRRDGFTHQPPKDEE